MERIKLLVHTPEKAKYPLLTLIEAMASMLNFHQGENEDLLSYLSRYKSERDIILTLYGNSFLDGYTINTDHYKGLSQEADQKAYKKEVLDRFLAALFLRNSDTGSYGNLVFKYREAYAGNEDKYPADVKTMLDIMRSQPKKNKKKKNGEKMIRTTRATAMRILLRNQVLRKRTKDTLASVVETSSARLGIVQKRQPCGKSNGMIHQSTTSHTGNK